jgi:asparagine synthase (glutamine-hydrolysing)
MTAIAGWVGSPDDDQETLCRAMLEAQRAYGSADVATRDLSGATFGRTLTHHVPEDIFDRQPLTDGERYLLVADIRLDNREELIRDLRGDLAEAADLSDADVLLHAWRRWQERSLDRIVGDFAFALFDTAERRLFLARDPTGQRPLFYARQDDMVAFASMPSGLLACPPLRTVFRFERLASMLVGLPDPGEGTYFEGICRVLPGHLAIITSQSAVQKVHWTPSNDHLRLSDEEFVQAYEDVLDTAVRSRLRREAGHVGVQLSSGYDSNAVAATAARLSDERIIALTSAPRLGFSGAVPRGRIADESGLAELTARMHGMQHLVIRPTTGVLSHLRSHSRLFQEPDRNVTNMEWWSAILAAGRELGVSTMLTGQFGNVTIHAGGLPILAEWVRRGEWAQWWSEARAASRRPGVRWRGVLINSFEGWLPFSLVQGLRRAFLGEPKLTEHSFLRDHWQLRVQAMARQETCARSSGDPYQDRLALIRMSDAGLFRKGALAESGIEERDPTADRRLIDFSFTLPPEQLLHRGVWRPLARRALAGRLPQAVINAPLRGYQGADWFERINPAQAREMLEEIASSASVQELLDLPAIEKAIEAWPAEGQTNERFTTIYRTRLTRALSAGVFLQEFEPLVGASG